MSKTMIGVVYGLSLAAVIVSMDILIFRDHPWPRLVPRVVS